MIPWNNYSFPGSNICTVYVRMPEKSTHTIHRWTPTITYITPNLKETYITLNKLLKILLQRWRLTMSSRLSLQIVAVKLQELLTSLNLPTLEIFTACNQNMETSHTHYMLPATKSPSGLPQWTRQVWLACWSTSIILHMSTLLCWTSSMIQWNGLPRTSIITVSMPFLQLDKFWHHRDQQ